jgi:4-hydroxythreonine-4-phosphate dehydrogenase
MAIDSLEAATDALMKGEIDVLVTAPINKDEMMKQGFKHAGHTGYFEEKFGKKGLMFLVTEKLKVAVSTHHIPVSEISKNISKQKIKEQVRVLNQSLIEDFCIQKPKIAILGLNPHAGDGGAIGKEEIEIIEPAIKELFNEGILAFGSFPADSFFQPEKYSSFDAVLAMYHDQGLPIVKFSGFEHGVNTTLGLPIIRTSVDHGTALNLAGSGKASSSSLIAALYAATQGYSTTRLP